MATYFKFGRDPIREKWMDTRRARHQLWWWCLRNPDHWISRNGIPCSINWRDEDRIRYFPNGFSHKASRKQDRRYNGTVEWGDDAFAKPNVEGKSSRKSMREKKRWWIEAEEAFD